MRPIFYVAFFLMVWICMALLLMVTIFVFLGVLVLPSETGPYAIRYAHTHTSIRHHAGRLMCVVYD